MTEQAAFKVAARPEPLVLGYTHEQSRWDRCIFWLMIVVCTSGLLQLPYLIQTLLFQLHRMGFLGPPFVGEGPPLPVTFARVWQTATRGTSGQIVSMLGVISGAVLMMRNGRVGKRLLLLASWCYCVLTTGAVVLFTMYLVERELSKARLGYTIQPFASWIPWQAANISVSIYPVLLLALILPQKKPRVKVIWWVTIGACLIRSIPVLGNWMWNFNDQWKEMFDNLLIMDREKELSPLLAIASLAETSAWFAAIVAGGWSLIDRPKGKLPLQICAALLAFSAFCTSVLQLFKTGRSDYWGWINALPGSSPFWSSFAGFTSAMAQFATAVAFPLAICIATRLAQGQANPMPIIESKNIAE